MKKLPALLLLLLCLPPLPALPAGRAAAAEELQLPPELMGQLDRKLPDWKFAEVREEIRRWLKESAGPDARPDLIRGDFDGDGEADYAALVEHGKVFGDEGVEIGPNVYIAAFLKRKSGYRLHLIEEGGEYLVLMKKGEKDYDYERQDTFVYANDAIFAGIFEKAGTSNVYEKGKFRAIITSD